MTAHGPVRTDRRNPLQRLIKRAKSPSWVGMKQEKLQGAAKKPCVHTRTALMLVRPRTAPGQCDRNPRLEKWAKSRQRECVRGRPWLHSQPAAPLQHPPDNAQILSRMSLVALARPTPIG